MKLNLGCGEKVREGYIGVDIKPFGNNVVLDVRDGLKTWGDNVIEAIIADNLIEHLTNTEVTNLLNECWRVLKRNGELHIIVPHQKNDGAWVLSHKSYYTEATFKFFERDDLDVYGFKKWKIKKIVTNSHQDIHCWMEPIK